MSIWIYAIAQLLKYNDPNMGSFVDNVVSVLRTGDIKEFFLISVLCMLACFLSGGLIIKGRFFKLSFAVVLGNSIAVSIMYAWFVTALIASPLLFSYWVLKNA